MIARPCQSSLHKYSFTTRATIMMFIRTRLEIKLLQFGKIITIIGLSDTEKV